MVPGRFQYRIYILADWSYGDIHDEDGWKPEDQINL